MTSFGSRRFLRLALAVPAIVLAVVGCTGNGASFAPAGPCVADGRAPGAYPDLEARLPPMLVMRRPDSVDSGRNCSDGALGALRAHGVTELRFAGAIWDQGNGNGTTIAVLALPPDAAPLPVAWVEEFYEAGARAGKKTENIQTSRPTFQDAGAVFRLDTLNDLSQQTVIVWPGGDVVHVVIAATRVEPGASMAAHEERVLIAVRTAANAAVVSSQTPSS